MRDQENFWAPPACPVSVVVAPSFMVTEAGVTAKVEPDGTRVPTRVCRDF